MQFRFRPCRTPSSPGDSKATARRRQALLAVLLGAAVLALVALGAWQLERRSWKHALIAAVDARAQAPAVPLPGPEAWPRLSAQADAYRHVRVQGTWLHDLETPVQALTVRGAGFWVVTPLRTAAGWTVLVNRGFVDPAHRDPASRPAAQPGGVVTVTGLLRPTEPGGGFLQRNDPAAGQWHSRDVAAIAAARGLPDTAPMFIDADDTPNPGGYPVGGLTVIAFADNHLVYALTWFTLAALGVAGLVFVVRGAPMAGARPVDGRG